MRVVYIVTGSTYDANWIVGVCKRKETAERLRSEAEAAEQVRNPEYADHYHFDVEEWEVIRKPR